MPIISLNNMPYTKEGIELKLTDEQKETLKVVYRLSEKNSDGYVFHELWHPEKEYSDDYIAVPLGSVYFGLSGTYSIGTNFANIEGSSEDPKPYKTTFEQYRSWRQLMKDKLPNWNTCCAETNKIYLSSDGSLFDGFECTNSGKELPNYQDYTKGIWMQGSHVLMNETSSHKVDTGAVVYMLPLCKNHNTYNGITSCYGTGYYMKLRRATKAIMLNAYFKKQMIDKLLNMQKHKDEEN